MNSSYDDIIHLPHYVSAKRPQMSMQDRAAQFSPFAALTGYDAEIHEAARLTEQRIELSEDEKQVLDRKQQCLLEHLDEHPSITVTYFVADPHKAGGSYTTTGGHLKRLDTFERALYLTNGARIPTDDILDMESDLF